MKMAIMQPYLFPYIGYFQLINAVDKFVVYDDVHFIKQGWINRNRILVNQKPFFFTVPLKDASSFRLIKDTEIHEPMYQQWYSKFNKTLLDAYRKAPFFETVFPLLESIFSQPGNVIVDLCRRSIKSVCEYLSIETEFVQSSTIYGNEQLKGQARVIDICRCEHAWTYINALGGAGLYNKKDFARENIELFFIKSTPDAYKQFNREFVAGLSIIDILMFNPKVVVREMLRQVEVVQFTNDSSFED